MYTFRHKIPRRKKHYRASVAPSGERFLAELEGAVGDRNVLRDPALRLGYERDWTGRFGADALAVVRPGSAEEIASVLAACSAAGVAVVPQGGNTGLVGGGVPRGGEVVLSTRRLDWVGEVDRAAGQLAAGAGATLQALQDRARVTGWDLAIDFAARSAATLGGAIATNAGGSRVLRFGSMRAQLSGVQAALSGGALAGSLTEPAKESVGVHLPSLLAGSEGTLAVITAARVRLVPSYRHRATALVALSSVEGLVALVATLRRELPDLDQAELMLPEGVELVCRTQGLPMPFGGAVHGAYLLLECAAQRDPLPELLECLDGASAIDDVAVAGTAGQREELRSIRERHTESIATLGVPLKLDVAVPISVLAETCERLRALVAELSAPSVLVLFGHAAEGNLHVNIVGAPGDWELLTEAVLALAVEAGGTISAEHGIGVAKSRFLHLVRSPAELALQAGLRRILDPAGILNPGVLAPS